MKKTKKRLISILNRAKSLDLTPDDLQQLEIVQRLLSLRKDSNSKETTNNRGKYLIILIVSFLSVVYFWHFYYLTADTQCLVSLPHSLTPLFREPEDCNICLDVHQIDRVENIDPVDFENRYAYSGKPVVVVDGTRDWSSLDTFTFEFFRDLYKNFQTEQEECQFFPYQTEFRNLNEALNMSLDRAHLAPGTKHWYFGWSSCESDATDILRKHYKKPYFLPKTSESTNLDWIFMGGPGRGAHLHVDQVKYPSWQAQLSGQKRWRLVPPPECYYSCEELETVVSPGEVIVVDTNRWYHQTFIVSKNVSITIGSEFD